MIFENANFSDNIVIVPPKPDASLSYSDEFSYSNLYGFDNNNNDNATDTATTSSCGGGDAATADTISMMTAPSPISSSTTLSSSRSSNSNVSFDSSNFDAAAAASSSSKLQQQSSSNSINSSSSNSNSLRDTSTMITRDPRNGTFTFQVHAEYDLLLHIQKDLDKYRRCVGGGDANANTNSSSASSSRLSDNIELTKIITRSVDEYCLSQQWMYHIGSGKGVAISRFLREGVESFIKRNQQSTANATSGEVKKFICVELGTYCGYSAIVLASTLCQFIQEQQQQQSQDEQNQQQPFEFHIYTTEVSTKLLNVAQSVFRLAKMEKYITPILMKSDGQESALADTLQKQHGISNIDFLLLDHAKDRYLEDLQSLETAKLLSAGSYVSADNVVFNRLDAYREHIHQLANQGIVESRLEEMNLEYSNNLKDGVEMTVYLSDPPVVAAAATTANTTE